MMSGSVRHDSFKGARGVLALLAGLALGIAALPTMAQEAPGESTDTVEAPENPDARLQEGDAPLDPDQILEDYEASEQISEDLSVSFPVDI